MYTLHNRIWVDRNVSIGGDTASLVLALSSLSAFSHKELDIVRRRYRRLMVRTAATSMLTVDGTARGVSGFFREAS